MARKVEIDLWVDKKDSAIGINKSEWIINYIKSNAPNQKATWVTPIEVNNDNLKDELHSLVNSGHAEFVKNMKAAWSREKYRQKNKSNTFALSKESHRQLRSLANETKSSIKQTIEDLISENYLSVRGLKIEEKKKLKRQKNVPSFSIEFPLQERKFLEKDIEDLKTKCNEQTEFLSALNLKIFQYQVFLEDLIIAHELDRELLSLSLTKEQEENAEKLMSDHKKQE